MYEKELWCSHTALLADDIYKEGCDLVNIASVSCVAKREMAAAAAGATTTTQGWSLPANGGGRGTGPCS